MNEMGVAKKPKYLYNNPKLNGRAIFTHLIGYIYCNHGYHDKSLIYNKVM